MHNEESAPLIRKHVDLRELLLAATVPELKAIADILLDSRNDRFLGNDSHRRKLEQHRSANELYRAVDDIAYEIRALGSVSLASSVLRDGEPVSYDEVVRDVAKELKIPCAGSDKTADIELKTYELLKDKVEEPTHRSDSDSGLLTKRAFLSSKPVFPAIAMATVSGNAAILARSVTVGLALYDQVVKRRQEFKDLSTIIVHVARIRKEIVESDFEDFLEKMRTYL